MLSEVKPCQTPASTPNFGVRPPRISPHQMSGGQTPLGFDGRHRHRYLLLFLHERDQYNRPRFPIIGLEYRINSLEGAVIQLDGLARFDAALLGDFVHAGLDVINDVIAHGGRLIGKADNTYHTAGGTKLGPHGVGLLQVDKDVTGKQWLELLGALACLDLRSEEHTSEL